MWLTSSLLPELTCAFLAATCNCRLHTCLQHLERLGDRDVPEGHEGKHTGGFPGSSELLVVDADALVLLVTGYLSPLIKPVLHSRRRWNMLGSFARVRSCCQGPHGAPHPGCSTGVPTPR